MRFTETMISEGSDFRAILERFLARFPIKPAGKLNDTVVAGWPDAAVRNRGDIQMAEIRIEDENTQRELSGQEERSEDAQA